LTTLSLWIWLNIERRLKWIRCETCKYIEDGHHCRRNNLCVVRPYEKCIFWERKKVNKITLFKGFFAHLKSKGENFIYRDE